MATLAERIEAHLKQLLAASNGIIEIQRRELARRFACVPSQINYVLETRFTPQRGYYVESRRGGGGYIRITRTVARRTPTTYESVYRQIGSSISREEAEELVLTMEERGVFSARQGALIRAALRQETAGLDPEWGDLVRAKLLKAMFLLVFYE